MMLPSRRPKLSSSEALESGTSVGSDHGEDDKGGAGIARKNGWIVFLLVSFVFAALYVERTMLSARPTPANHDRQHHGDQELPEVQRDPEGLPQMHPDLSALNHGVRGNLPSRHRPGFVSQRSVTLHAGKGVAPGGGEVGKLAKAHGIRQRMTLEERTDPRNRVHSLAR